jgi:tetratricopeptide (TPR) repeat protein
LRGFSQIHLESYQNAVTDLDEALKKLETVAQSTLSGSDSARLNRLFIACKSGKGWALTRMGKERQGQAVLGEVIGYSNRKASLPYIYRGLSQAAAGAGDRGALNDFDVAMRAEGTEPVAYREAGRIYAHSKTLASPTLALRLSQQACELSGYNDWSSLEVFADALRANDRKADAEKWYQKAFDMAPSEHLPRIHQKLIVDQQLNHAAIT